MVETDPDSAPPPPPSRHHLLSAEQVLRAPVHNAVITVPAYFNDAQRKATMQAAEMAGLKVRLQRHVRAG